MTKTDEFCCDLRFKSYASIWRFLCTSILQEIFGPIVTVYVYPDEKYREIAELANETSPFALTGAIYAGDKYVKF